MINIDATPIPCTQKKGSIIVRWYSLSKLWIFLELEARFEHFQALLRWLKGTRSQVGKHLLCTLFCTRDISKRRCILPRNFSLEKNQVPRELALIAISLACLLAPWNVYGGTWKWVTILPILVKYPAVVCHLFLYSFICAPTTAFTWLSKVWTSQLSSVIFTYLGTSPGAEFHFGKVTYNFQKKIV